VHGMSSTSRRRSKLWRCCFGISVLHWKLRCKTVASIFRVNLDCFQAHIERMSGDVRRQRSSEERYYLRVVPLVMCCHMYLPSIVAHTLICQVGKWVCGR
jgi:hypothetical protein